MKILVINAGSSSLKFQLIDMEDESVKAKGLVERIGIEGTHFKQTVAEGNKDAAVCTYKVAVKAVDKAAGKNLIHKNKAAHKKSQMTLKLNGMAE